MTTIHWMPPNVSSATPVPETAVGGRLEVVVIHTAIPATLQALKIAATLAQGLSAQIRLLVPQVVPYAVPLDSPPVPISFLERRFRVVAQKSATETSVEIILCRELLPALQALLRPRSLVVLGERSTRWWRLPWPGAERKLARRLRRLGHQVVFAELP